MLKSEEMWLIVQELSAPRGGFFTFTDVLKAYGATHYASDYKPNGLVPDGANQNVGNLIKTQLRHRTILKTIKGYRMYFRAMTPYYSRLSRKELWKARGKLAAQLF